MNFTKNEITKILNFILLCVVVYICYKFHKDVLYKMQIQIPLLTKTYFWTDSREFCLAIVIAYLLCLVIMRWWFTLMVIIPLLPLPYCVIYWLKIRYNYTQGFINGMIWHKELFNYNFNVYVYKTLEEWQKSWVVRRELTQRKNATSFLVYEECRDFHLDPYITQFFDDFHLDYADSDSFERIRAQIDIYQRAKIKLAHSQMHFNWAIYKAEHPFKYYGEKILDYVIEYPERIFVYTGLSIIMFSLAYYHY